MSPRKSFIFIIKQNYCWIKVSKLMFYFVLEKNLTDPNQSIPTRVCLGLKRRKHGPTDAHLFNV